LKDVISLGVHSEVLWRWIMNHRKPPGSAARSLNVESPDPTSLENNARSVEHTPYSTFDLAPCDPVVGLDLARDHNKVMISRNLAVHDLAGSGLGGVDPGSPPQPGEVSSLATSKPPTDLVQVGSRLGRATLNGAALDGAVAVAEALHAYGEGSVSGKKAVEHIARETLTGAASAAAGVGAVVVVSAVTGPLAAPVAGLLMVGASSSARRVIKKKSKKWSKKLRRKLKRLLW